MCCSTVYPLRFHRLDGCVCHSAGPKLIPRLIQTPFHREDLQDSSPNDRDLKIKVLLLQTRRQPPPLPLHAQKEPLFQRPEAVARQLKTLQKKCVLRDVAPAPTVKVKESQEGDTESENVRAHLKVCQSHNQKNPLVWHQRNQLVRVQHPADIQGKEKIQRVHQNLLWRSRNRVA